MNQFQRNEPAREVQYGNPFDMLLDRPFKPVELKAYKPEPEIAVEAFIDVCAVCGEPKCSCRPRITIKVKV